ncbi:MAG: S1 RNA-binding domain-containing protein [Gammaproteobacteria bacterium]|nr:S1 RNA-binding domain-containing protein [Gammaproteobacteria bacterium]
MQTKFAMSIVAACVLGASVSTPVLAEEPYMKPDDTWISISGTVKHVETDTFTVNYGEGIISVEMDDGDRDADAYKLFEGDKVTVNGRVDDDLFETATLEASSVYVEDIGTTFYSSSVDEEDAYAVVNLTTPIVVSATWVEGNVTDVNGEEFSIDTGPRQIRVDVSEMPYNPLDDKGYQKVEKDDRVRVTGNMDDDLLEGRELMADSVVTLAE